MNVFKLRSRLVDEYGSYVRSFIQIRDARIRDRVAAEMEGGLLWPDPLIQLNPSFAPGGTVEDLVAAGALHAECARIFRADKVQAPAGRILRLYRHQVEAIEAAWRAGAMRTAAGRSARDRLPALGRRGCSVMALPNRLTSRRLAPILATGECCVVSPAPIHSKPPGDGGRHESD